MPVKPLTLLNKTYNRDRLMYCQSKIWNQKRESGLAFFSGDAVLVDLQVTG